jgi:hypothetical protein
MEGGDEEVVKEHKTMWQLACLVSIPLRGHIPRDWSWLPASSIGSHNIDISAFLDNM